MAKKINKYLLWLAKQNGVTDVQYENVQLSNYSNTVQVLIKNSSVIEFDETLQIAKAKIDECFDEWGKDANPNLRLIVNSYFRVGKKGFINKAAILGLFQFDIDHPKWAEAMELIRKSITPTEKKSYFQIRYRCDKDDEWMPLNLNFSSLQKTEVE